VFGNHFKLKKLS